MKRLTITYDGVTLFDGEVAEIAWKDSENEVSVTGKQRKQSAATAVSGLGDMLAKARKAQTEKLVTEKREAAGE